MVPNPKWCLSHLRFSFIFHISNEIVIVAFVVHAHRSMVAVTAPSGFRCIFFHGHPKWQYILSHLNSRAIYHIAYLAQMTGSKLS